MVFALSGWINAILFHSILSKNQTVFKKSVAFRQVHLLNPKRLAEQSSGKKLEFYPRLKDEKGEAAGGGEGVQKAPADQPGAVHLEKLPGLPGRRFRGPKNNKFGIFYKSVGFEISEHLLSSWTLESMVVYIVNFKNFPF